MQVLHLVIHLLNLPDVEGASISSLVARMKLHSAMRVSNPVEIWILAPEIVNNKKK